MNELKALKRNSVILLQKIILKWQSAEVKHLGVEFIIKYFKKK